MNVKNCALILVVMLFMTSACGAAPSAPPTPTATLTPTSTPRPTDTPVPTRPKPTATLRPTATRRPTATPDLNRERQRQLDAIFSTMDLPDQWTITQVEGIPQGTPGIKFSTAQMLMQGPYAVRGFFEVIFWEDQSSFYSNWLTRTDRLGLIADEESLPESDTLYSSGQDCFAKDQAMDPQYPCFGTIIRGWSFVAGGNREYMVIWANSAGETEEHAHEKADELVGFILNALDAMFSTD